MPSLCNHHNRDRRHQRSTTNETTSMGRCRSARGGRSGSRLPGGTEPSKRPQVGPWRSPRKEVIS
jgi:hypothetical protein